LVDPSVNGCKDFKRFKNSCKAQSGTETFMVVFVLVIVLVFALMTYIDRNSDATAYENMMGAEMECYRIAALINRVRMGEEGFSEQVSFISHTSRIFGNTRGIEVSYRYGSGIEEDYYCTFLTSNVTNGTHYVFDVSGDYLILNEGDNITFYKT
jgi:hypothetical protein